MKFKFFGPSNPELDVNLCLKIFSYIPEDTSPVNNRWNALNKDKKRMLPMLSTLYQVPQFQDIVPEKFDITTLSGGMTNSTFKVSIVDGRTFVFRIAGEGTSCFINRCDEQLNASKAAKMGLNVNIHWFDKKGNQLTSYLSHSEALSSPLVERRHLKPVANIFKMLHGHGDLFENTNHITDRIRELWSLVETKNPSLFPPETHEISENIYRLAGVLGHFIIPLSCCHNDPTPANFLMVDSISRLYLLDWEYSGNNDLLWDLVYFCSEAKLDKETTLEFLTFYFGEVTESINAWFIVYQPLVTWWITLWSLAQIANGSTSSSREDYMELANKNCLMTLDFFQSRDYQQALLCIEESRQSMSQLSRSF